MKYGLLLLVAAGMFALAADRGLSQDTSAEETGCEEILSEKQDLKEQYTAQKHNEKKAFSNWDKYYKELHSIEYGGTERPLAETAKACREGDGPDKPFCKEALKRYDELAEKEGQAKKELDATKENAGQLGASMRALSQKAQEKGCK